MISRLATAAALGIALTTTAVAQGRPDSRTMSCGQVQSLIVQRGAVVLTTGQYTYDRYISGRGYCSWPNVPTRTSIAAADTNRCPVYNCQPADDPMFD
jgi:hypothetical protein